MPSRASKGFSGEARPVRFNPTATPIRFKPKSNPNTRIVPHFLVRRAPPWYSSDAGPRRGSPGRHGTSAHGGYGTEFPLRPDRSAKNYQQSPAPAVRRPSRHIPAPPVSLVEHQDPRMTSGYPGRSSG